MVTRLNTDLLAGAFFIVVGALMGVIATHYPFGSAGEMGPGYLPLTLSVLILVFGIVIGLRGLRAAHKETLVFALPIVLAIVAAVAAFGPLLERFGLVVAIPLLVVVSRVIGGHRNWIEILLISVVLTVFCALVFVWALNGSIPIWPK